MLSCVASGGLLCSYLLSHYGDSLTLARCEQRQRCPSGLYELGHMWRLSSCVSTGVAVRRGVRTASSFVLSCVIRPN